MANLPIKAISNYKEIKVGAIFTIVGLVMLGIAAFLFVDSGSKDDYIKVSGEITKINVIEATTEDENDTHEVYARYEVDGVTYETKLDSYDVSMTVGSTVEFYVDPEDPSKVYTDKTVIIIILAIMAGIAVFAGASSLVKAGKQIKADKELKEREAERGRSSENRPKFEDVVNNAYDWNIYHYELDTSEWKNGVGFVNKFKMLLTDANEQVVYEIGYSAVQTILGNKADFTNHIKNQTTTHKFGMEVESQENSVVGVMTEALNTNKTWTFDGVDSVVYLRKMGIRVYVERATQMGIGAYGKFVVTQEGRPLAAIEPASFVAPTGLAAVLGSMPNGMCFNIKCAQKDLDDVMIVAFALMKGCNILE